MTAFSALLLGVLTCTVIVAGFGFNNDAKQPLQLRLGDGGAYDIVVNGNVWLSSGDTAFYANGGWVSGLKVKSNSTRTGSDGMGKFSAVDVVWDASSDDAFEVTTSFYVYEDGETLAFEQVWNSGASKTNAGGQDDVSSAFPSFKLKKPDCCDVGLVGWKGTFIDDSTHGPAIGPFPDTVVTGNDGGPFVLFDADSKDAIVVSPRSQFMTSSFAHYGSDKSQLAAGLYGTVQQVPAGFTLGYVISYNGNGLNSAMMSWGTKLLNFHGKPRDGPAKDFTLQYLGYNTDHGAYFYYNPLPGKDFNYTLVQVYESAKEQDIPYQWILLDSWWYFKGPNDGVKNWTARPDIFPPGGTDGLKEFHKITNWPIIGHNRWWSPTTDYSKENGGKFDFSTKDAKMVVPLEQAFWDFLISTSVEWGLAVYEQDWLYNEFNGVPLLTENATMAREWLLQMGRAAQKNNITIQYCMPYPRHAMQSAEIPAVTQIRASDDYVPGADGPDQWRLGSSSIFAWALALAPFKDNFWTTPREPGSSEGKTGHDDAVWREAAVATLSSGPVTPADGIPYQNKPLIMRSCRTDGKLLKPDRPAVSVDEYFRKQAFSSKSGPSGQLWASYAMVSSMRYDVLFSAEQGEPYNVTRESLTADRPSGPSSSAKLVAYSLTNATSFDQSTAVAFELTETQPIPLRKSIDGNDFEVWHVAPVLSNGLAVLGDMTKWMPATSQRIASIGVGDNGSTQVDVLGGSNEKVSIFYTRVSSASEQAEPFILGSRVQALPHSLAIKMASCTTGSDGKCSVSISA